MTSGGRVSVLPSCRRRSRLSLRVCNTSIFFSAAGNEIVLALELGFLGEKESILRVPQHPYLRDAGLIVVVHDSVVLTSDNLRLVNGEATAFTDFDFPMLGMPIKVSVPYALLERATVLNDGLLNLLREVTAATAADGRLNPYSSKMGAITS
jgi:hypothetical protein